MLAICLADVIFISLLLKHIDRDNFILWANENYRFGHHIYVVSSVVDILVVCSVVYFSDTTTGMYMVLVYSSLFLGVGFLVKMTSDEACRCFGRLSSNKIFNTTWIFASFSALSAICLVLPDFELTEKTRDLIACTLAFASFLVGLRVPRGDEVKVGRIDDRLSGQVRDVIEAYSPGVDRIHILYLSMNCKSCRRVIEFYSKKGFSSQPNAKLFCIIKNGDYDSFTTILGNMRLIRWSQVQWMESLNLATPAIIDIGNYEYSAFVGFEQVALKIVEILA